MAEVVNRTPAGTPVTVFPKGTCNLLARHLGIKQSPEDVAQMLCEGAVATLDAGRANGRIFLLMVGCGFDGDVAHRLHQRRSGGNSSRIKWVWPMLTSFRQLSVIPSCGSIVIRPARSCRGPSPSARWVFVANLPCYAGGLVAAPSATGFDGKLDVALFAGGSLWHDLRYAFHVFWRRHQQLSDFRDRCGPRADRGRSAGAVPIGRRRGRVFAVGHRSAAGPIDADRAARIRPISEPSTHADPCCGSHLVPNNPAQIGPYTCGRGQRLLVIAGPCVIETEELTLEIAERLAELAKQLPISLVFKASFDKANRTSLRCLSRPRHGAGPADPGQSASEATGLPVTTDMHES